MYRTRAARPVASRRLSSTRTGAKIRTIERDFLDLELLLLGTSLVSSVGVESRCLAALEVPA